MYWSNPYEAYMPNHMMQEPNPSIHLSRKEDRIFSEDILEKNIGQMVTAYMTFEGSNVWRDKIFTGKLMAVGRDFFVLRELPESINPMTQNPTNQRTENIPPEGQDRLLYNINLDYFVFHNHIKK